MNVNCGFLCCFIIVSDSRYGVCAMTPKCQSESQGTDEFSHSSSRSGIPTLTPPTFGAYLRPFVSASQRKFLLWMRFPTREVSTRPQGNVGTVTWASFPINQSWLFCHLKLCEQSGVSSIVMQNIRYFSVKNGLVTIAQVSSYYSNTFPEGLRNSRRIGSGKSAEAGHRSRAI